MKRKPAEKRHVPNPDYFAGKDTLPPPGMWTDTACEKLTESVVEDPDAATCKDCKSYLQRRPQFYNFLKVRWGRKKAGKYLAKTHGE